MHRIMAMNFTEYVLNHGFRIQDGPTSKVDN